MVYVMPLVSFVIPLIAGVLAVRNRMAWVVPLMTAMLAALMA